MTIVTGNHARSAPFVRIRLDNCHDVADTPRVSFRSRSVDPVSDWGRFLYRQRREHGWSATKAHEQLHVGLGYALKSRAAYDALEAGTREPTKDQQAFLVKFFGSGPNDEDRVSTASPRVDATGLAALIEAQTRAIEEQTVSNRELAAAINRAAGTVTGSVVGFGEVLALVAARLGVELPQSDAEPPQPRPNKQQPPRSADQRQVSE